MTAVKRSDDPLIAYVLRIRSDVARGAARLWEEEVQGPINYASERIARVRFAVEGANLYPDATFSPRLSYGRVAGWRDRRARSSARSPRLADLFARATGAEPYRLPAALAGGGGHAQQPSTVLNFPNDQRHRWRQFRLAGGGCRRERFSASPSTATRRRSAGEFTYDGAANRTIVVSTAAITEVLANVYGRTALLQ